MVSGGVSLLRNESRLTLVDDRLDVLPDVMVQVLASDCLHHLSCLLAFNVLDVVEELGLLSFEPLLDLFSVVVLEGEPFGRQDTLLVLDFERLLVGDRLDGSMEM